MHQALYRKWRPQTFEDVCGQEHITSILKYEAIIFSLIQFAIHIPIKIHRFQFPMFPEAELYREHLLFQIPQLQVRDSSLFPLDQLFRKIPSLSTYGVRDGRVPSHLFFVITVFLS